MKDTIKRFFDTVEGVWGVIPSYAKVFFYSVISSVIGLYMNDGLNAKSVLFIVVSNLGLYQIPRSVGAIMKK